MPETSQSHQQTAGAGIHVPPATKAGSIALWLSAAALASWIVLPVITSVFHERHPVTDSWVMPAIGAVLIDLAAVACVLALWRFRERSVLNVIAAAIVIPAAIMLTMILVGEGLSGA
jgi:hypothetical protein